MKQQKLFYNKEDVEDAKLKSWIHGALTGIFVGALGLLVFISLVPDAWLNKLIEWLQ